MMTLRGFVFNLGAALVSVEFFYLFEFLDDDGAEFFLGGEDGFVVFDAAADFFQLVGNFVDGKFGEAVQLQFENGFGLARGEGLFGVKLGSAAGGVDVDFLAGEIGDQVFAGLGAVGAGADDGDDVIEMIERVEIAFEDMLAVFGLLQQERGAAPDYVNAVIDEVLDGLDQSHFAGLAVDHREQDHGKTFLHGGVFVELVENDLRLGAAFEFDDDAHAVAIAFVTDIGNVFDVFVVDELRDAFDEAGFVYLIRNFSDDDGLTVFGNIFDGGFGAHHEAAATGAVGFENSGASVDDAGGGEVGALDEL
jgi:hypothetical protein